MACVQQSKWMRKRTKTGPMPGVNVHGVATERPRVMLPPEPGDHDDADTNECLGKPIHGHVIRDRSNKENSESRFTINDQK